VLKRTTITPTRPLSKDHIWCQHCQGAYHPGSATWKESLEVSRRVLQGRRVGPWSEMRERKGPPLPHGMAFEWSWTFAIPPSLREVLGPTHKEIRYGFDGFKPAPVQVVVRIDSLAKHESA